ncbi:recQ-mediated genome instability protein 1-like [Thrips palmi]|uniref:RecQ-mediated genome instability protein 1 n=1 Tax=Thrips palmi TaxID=161013 RepID=A0A6P8Z341_THRPL|nr:recQ-mediated genome instability protein 1-like [Thrips palmi]
MSENGRDLAATLAALKSHGCHVNRDWLTECVNFFRSENNRYSPKDLEKFVFDQWLLGDLREIASSGSLPPNLSNILKTTVEGKMACQIESCIDIGHSAYNQMQRVRKEDVGNSQIDENKEYQQSWEPKSNRCLQFTLCDGVQTIKAIEYKFISLLKTDMIPGLKILLHGPIECRRGVLLLEEKHVTILGGEVDALAIVNAYENELAKKLNIPANPDPYNMTARPTVPQVQPQPLPPPAQQPGQQHQPPQANQRAPQITDNRRQQNQPTPHANQRVLQITDNRRPQNKPRTARASEQPKKLVQSALSWSNQPRPAQANPSQSPSLEFAGNDEDFMNIPLDPADWAEEMNYESAPTQRRKPDEINSASKSSTSNWGTGNANRSTCATSSAAEFLNEFDESDEALLLQAEASLVESSVSSLAQNEIKGFKSNATQKNAGSSVPIIQKNTKEEAVSSKRLASSALPEECLRKPLFAKRRKETSSSQEVTSSTDATSTDTSYLAPDLLDFDDPAETSNSIPISLPPQPFVYLSQINQSKVSVIYRVKAAVITVIEKLSISQDKWKLSAKISDGSANVVVKFSNEVLEELFGMTAVALNEMKKEVVKQPEKKEIMKKKLEKAQCRLINLNCLLDLKMCGEEQPLVVGFEDISSSTISALKNRHTLLNS